jgi:hypothetical protein
MQLGLTSLESNDRIAMKIFRQVVLECATRLFAVPAPALPAARRLQVRAGRVQEIAAARAAS